MLYEVVVYIGGEMLYGADVIIIERIAINITSEFMRGIQDSSLS